MRRAEELPHPVLGDGADDPLRPAEAGLSRRCRRRRRRPRRAARAPRRHRRVRGASGGDAQVRGTRQMGQARRRPSGGDVVGARRLRLRRRQEAERAVHPAGAEGSRVAATGPGPPRPLLPDGRQPGRLVRLAGLGAAARKGPDREGREDRAETLTRLLLLTPSELTRDPRARRAALAARARGLSPVGLSGQISGADPIELDGVPVARLPRERVAPGLRAAGLGGMKRESPLVREARGLYRLLRLARVTAGLYRTGRILGRFDVVHANDLDTLPAAWLLARASGARLVYDAHELYTDQEPDPPRLHRAVARLVEGALARRAGSVVTVSEPIADELRRRLRLRE